MLISESFYRNCLSDIISIVYVGPFASRSQVSLQMNPAFWSIEILELNTICNIGKVKFVFASMTFFFIRCHIKHLELQSGVLNTRYGEGLAFSYVG